MQIANRSMHDHTLSIISMRHGVSIGWLTAAWSCQRRSSRRALGHSSIVMTMDIHGHLFPQSDAGSELAAAERRLLR
jgi:hypothetical protein